MSARAHGMDFLAIREQSARRLGRWRLADPETLPRHDDEDVEWMRHATAVMGRCHAIAAARALAHRAPVRTVREAIDDHELERWTDRRELDLLQILQHERAIDEQAMQRLLVDIAWREEALLRLLVDIAWREEALLPLLWTLRLVDELAPDKMCPNEPVYERLAPGLDPALASSDLRLRPLQEIAAMLDLCYCLHRQAPSAQYHGEISDYRIAPGVVLERRRALECLFQDAPWAELDLSA